MKKITALFTVLMLLVASSAMALDAVFPSAMNGSSARFFTGFNVNASISDTAVDGFNTTLTVFNTTGVHAYTLKSATGKYDGNSTIYGTFGVNNSTTDTYFSYTQGNGTAANASNFKNGLTYQNIPGLNMLNYVNGTSDVASGTHVLADPYYMINTAGYDLLTGLNNATFAFADGEADTDGANFILGYTNGSFEGSDVYSSDNTWDMYAVGYNFNTAKPYYILGQVKLNSAPGTDNAEVKYVKYDSDGTVTDNTGSWITYNATDGQLHQKLSVFYKGQMPLVENATINTDRTMFSGYASETNYKHFAIFVKNGVELSTSDIQSRGFKMAYAGHGIAKGLGNATGGIMDFQFDADLGLTGDVVDYSGLAVFKARQANINGYSAALASTSQFKLSQSNMTLTQADASTLASNFYGKFNAEKTYAVGIYQTASAGSKVSYNLAVMVPNAAVVANVQGANSAYQNNSTLATFNGIAYNSTSYSKTALRTAWTDVPSDFAPLTDVIGFNATWNVATMTDQRGDVYYTFQIPFTGVGNKISTLALYKLFPTTDKTVRSFSYSESPSVATDGAWWISQTSGDGYMNTESYLVPSTEYFLNYVIKDNGDYDYKAAAAREIGDPLVLGTIYSSSSSSGCVFNPAAGFGLEWLLLMLAPMVAVVRSRFK